MEQKRRGIRTAFRDDGIKPIKTIGRSEDLVRKRNERLCARLYWYRLKAKYNYDDILVELQREFDISAVTISKIIQGDEWQDELIRLRQQKPGIDYFRHKYPFMRWRA